MRVGRVLQPNVRPNKEGSEVSVRSSKVCGLRFFAREEKQKGIKVFYGFALKRVSKILFSAGKEKSHKTRMSFLG